MRSPVYGLLNIRPSPRCWLSFRPVAVRCLSVFQGNDNTTTNCCISLVHSLRAGPELPSGQGWPGGPIAGVVILDGMGGAVGRVGACGGAGWAFQAVAVLWACVNPSRACPEYWAGRGRLQGVSCRSGRRSLLTPCRAVGAVGCLCCASRSLPGATPSRLVSNAGWANAGRCPVIAGHQHVRFYLPLMGLALGQPWGVLALILLPTWG